MRYMNECPTWVATIWIGTKNRSTGELVNSDLVRETLQKYCERGFCVSLTPTEFIYKGGNEPGFAIGLINYPRFPVDAPVLVDHALKIAEIVQNVCKQHTCSVVMPGQTVLLRIEPGSASWEVPGGIQETV